jgi:hypothetical protein
MSRWAGWIVTLAMTATPIAAQPPQLAGCEVFPRNNIWNIRVDGLPLDERSATYVATIGRDAPVHPDFGSGDYPPGSGSPIGIPWIGVPASQPRVPVAFLYAEESDPGPYPIPGDPPIEGGPDADGDRHVLVVDRDRCRLYELFYAFPEDDGSWRADSGAVFDLGSNALRPETWTSADAAGLPILPGLVRFEEVAAGEIRHALRFTAPQTRRAFVWPARHFASSLTGSRYPPMGQRFRLRADFDVSGFSPRNRVILTALKRYGMMLADNGSAWFLSGVPDERWDNDQLRELRQVRGADFEAVDVSSLLVDPDSGATDLGDDDDDDGGEPFVCAADATTLCLNRGRFRVRVSWRDFEEHAGQGRVVPFAADDSGLLWFFADDNWEMLVKVLDGCAFNGRYWVFAAATTDVAYRLEVADSLTGAVRTYRNLLGRASPAITDTTAFDSCP